jgi:hypothetical protein
LSQHHRERVSETTICCVQLLLLVRAAAYLAQRGDLLLLHVPAAFASGIVVAQVAWSRI